MFCFVLIFKQVYGRPGLWLIDAIIFSFPWNRCRDLNEIIWESSSFKMSLYFWQIYPQIWPPWPQIIWCISDFCSETDEWISKNFLQEVLTKFIAPLNQFFIWYSLTTTRLPWYLIDLLVFNFSAPAARILTKCKGRRYNCELILLKIYKSHALA